MATKKLELDEVITLVTRALEKSGATSTNAASTARALIYAERDGQKGHGLLRVASYCGQVVTGKINGAAIPALKEISASSICVNANYGFAYPTIDLAIDELIKRSKSEAVCLAAIAHSHHFGQAGAHVERLAEQGLIALAFSNSPAGIAFWGSPKPAMGTNPIAFASPLPGQEPLVIDLAVSVAARGKIVNAQKNGASIPLDWALDGQGNPTSNPDEALKGSMTPMGGAKGAALAMMIEILTAGLTGSHFGFEASSFFEAEGDAPNIAHTMIAINPTAISGDLFMQRMAVLIDAIDDAEHARLPGTSRLTHRKNTTRSGLEIPESLYKDILNLT